METFRLWLSRLGTGLAILVLVFFGLRSFWTERPKDKVVLTVWGLQSGEETKGLDAQLREFERRYPNIRVQNLQLGAGTGMNAQKLLTSIVGDVPPDLVRQDRFTIGDWASRETFVPLDRFLSDPELNNPNDPWHIDPRNYYEACWAEAIYQGKVYAIPDSTDNRLLYWNKDLFRKAGLDPERPPRTWEELVEYTEKLTKTRPDGSFETIGFIPVAAHTNSFFYLYSWQAGGEFMSPDGRTCTLNNAATEEALQWLTDFYDRFRGAEEITAFAGTFQPNENNPLLTGKMAMLINTNLEIRNFGRYGPEVDFGVAPPPVPAARLRGEGRYKGVDPFITWSGGFSYAIPVGSRHPKEAWQFIKWMNSLESRRIFNAVQREFNLTRSPPQPYVPDMHADRRINEIIFKEFAPQGDTPLARRLRAGMQVGLDLMPHARFRPVTFIGLRLWDEHMRAYDQAIRKRLTPEQALAAGQATVQRELDAAFNRERQPLLNTGWAVGICIAVSLGLLVAFVLYCTRGGRLHPLHRSEARAGYAFATPWIIGFLVLFLGPMLASIVFSLCDYDVLHPPRWVGAQNYTALWQDPVVWKSLYNIFYLALIGIPLGIFISLGLAMLLNSKVKGLPVYRTLFYVPSLTPVVAAALLWLFMLNVDGVLNQAWRATLSQWFNLPAPTWMSSEQWSKPGLIFMSLWGAGGGIILWLAGLQGVPQHLYEAADLDGAGAWHRFRHVTLPMLTPYILFNLVMGTIGWVQRFTDIYVMTNGQGGPVDSTMVPVLYLFNNAFQYFKMGYASAWAWIIFAVVMALTAFNLWASKHWVHYEGERK